MKDNIRDYAIPKALSEVVSDVAQLFQAELRLAKAEISSGISAKLQSAIWFGVVAILTIVSFTFFAAGVALAISSTGIGLHWACLMVATGIGILALGAVAIARSLLARNLIPERTIRQVQKDIQTVQERV
jgi:VIT1/CCC1 family predicted Fe2+/Mn2+ transporter